jgi:hypothetical protein
MKTYRIDSKMNAQARLAETLLAWGGVPEPEIFLRLVLSIATREHGHPQYEDIQLPPSLASVVEAEGLGTLVE